MKLFYLSHIEIPSYKANAIQIMHMCDSFAYLGLNVTLIHASSESYQSHTEILPYLREIYGIRSSFSLKGLSGGRIPNKHLFGLRSALFAKRSGADAVFGRFLPSIAWSAILGLPSVLEVHQPVEGKTKKAYLAMLGHGARLKGLASITASLKRKVMECDFRRVPDNHSLVEPDGVQISAYVGQSKESARRKLDWPREGFHAVYCGSLYPGKGADLILEMAGRAGGVEFTFVGGDKTSIPQCTQKARRMGLPNARFVGRVNPSSVPTYLIAADVLLLPNQRSVQGSSGGDIGKWTSPLKLFEYMAAGRPIIASDLDVLREILNEGCAVFCDPDDPEQWAKTLLKVKQNYQDYLTMGHAARHKAEQYTWEKRAKRCLDLFNLE